ncbi:hypothetical protein ACTA71_000601 [Dictyostelium dimigraforme]
MMVLMIIVFWSMAVVYQFMMVLAGITGKEITIVNDGKGQLAKLIFQILKSNSIGRLSKIHTDEIENGMKIRQYQLISNSISTNLILPIEFENSYQIEIEFTLNSIYQ